MPVAFANVGARCSAQDCVTNLSSSSSSDVLYEFLVDASDASAVYYWKVHEDKDDEGAGQTLLDCVAPGNCTGANYRSPSSGYYCACLPTPSDDDMLGCRHVVFGVPRLGTALLAVNGTQVAEIVGSNDLTLMGDYASNLSAVAVGAHCPSSPCPRDDESLLEIYQHRPPHISANETRRTISIDLDDLSIDSSATNTSSVRVASWNASNQESVSGLLYLRRCVASAACHRLTMGLANDQQGQGNGKRYEQIETAPTLIRLDGMYYANQDVVFDESSYSTMLGRCAGSNCDNTAAGDGRPNGSGILAVTVDTKAAAKDLPRGMSTWFVYDAASANGNTTLYTFANPGRDESLYRFDRGYPSASSFQAHVCLPPTEQPEDLAVIIAKALPHTVAVTLARDGEALPCREPFVTALNSSGSSIWVRGSSYMMQLDRVDAVVAPLDGSCSTTGSPSLSGGPIAGIVIGAVAGLMALTFVASAWHRRRSRPLPNNDSHKP